ncbi:ATP-binding protein [Vibrio splendidus]|uniref:ATP-binding protein n=1 Tax=Vibrio splendidus TaxID=29497 RepID=UPI000D332950|nr:ATP-binding protein [Vibrio splendidus]PTQ16482.1 ATP-binding protein [Vibrio splendidus]
MGFRVNKVRNHVLWNKEDDDRNAFTVIIGNNGCGKTELLIDTCNKYHSYYASALLDKNSHVASAVHYLREDFSPHNWKSVEREYGHRLPRKLIAASTSQFEKFKANWSIRGDLVPSGFYAYIGSKPYMPSLSPSTRIASKAIQQLLGTEYFEERKQKALVGFLSKFDFGQKLLLKFELTFPNKDLENIQSQLPTEPETQLVLKNAFIEHDEMELVELLSYCESIVENPEFALTVSNRSLDLIHLKNAKQSAFSKLIISRMLRAGLITLSSIQTMKDKSKRSGKSTVDIENTSIASLSKRSSGEQCLFLLFMGIISSIEDNALICIDEPEISLHPQWQERFVDILSESFSSYHGCHFLIATHSPLIVSDISAKNCCVYDMATNTLSDAAPYGERSSDYQLAMLFHNPGNNNEYLLSEVIEVLDDICQSNDISSETRIKADWLLNYEPCLPEGDKVKRLLTILQQTLEAFSK